LVLVGKPKGKRQIGRPKHRWKDNIKVDPEKMEWDDIDWIDVTEGRNQWRALLNTVMNLRVP
jgi:hypothetical protein